MTKRVRVIEEFAGTELGDVRLDDRLERIVSKLSRTPAHSFPVALGSDSELEGLYRFLRNPSVTSSKLLAGHLARSLERCGAAKQIRILHDTTEFSFSGDREGLGIIEDSVKGFLGHFSLAVSAGEGRPVPLGVLGVLPYIHAETEARRGKTKSEQVMYSRALPRTKKESSRWEKQAAAVQELLPEQVGAIHVMDQEADDYTLLAELSTRALRFVVRGAGDRLTQLAGQRVCDVLEAQQGRVFRTVRVNRRPAKRARTKGHPVREERAVSLHIRWAKLVLPRPSSGQTEVRELAANVVHVYEPHPPPGETPVEWYLFTNEPVDTLEQAIAVVIHHRDG